MPTYYTEFSTFLSLTPEQADWADALLVKMELAAEDEREMSGDYPALSEFTIEGQGSGFEVHRTTLARQEGMIGYAIASGEDKNGNVECAMQFITEVLDQFGMDDIVMLEWSNSCSRPVLEGFGGGVAAITRQGSEALTTKDIGDIVAMKAKEGLEAGNSPTPG